ncbi:hypothetical protein Lesp02_03210 [Lentzea sp. NBRC 105346]|uniref:MobF family relaxase n=1 Tax=Lentzea sp. NBRC 105346 TaxID=3032205 RepID=UPI0024A224F8|nr:MobF family relaxase [Lentzea sp. NBRC 105346]GLZ28131.1 hypothetical protein Lesp02_03210 [Lentzea sp. NBRC 105346]
MAYVTPIGFNAEQIEYRLDGGHGCNSNGNNDRRFSHRTNRAKRTTASGAASTAEDPQVAYRTQGAEDGNLVWFGAGLADVDIQAGTTLTPSQFPLARNLMACRHPHTGAQLVKPKLGVYEDAKLPLAPLIRAIHAIAHEANVPVSEVLHDPTMRSRLAAAERAVASKGEGANLRADEAGELADAAHLNVDHVWGESRYATAVGNLWETVTEVDADGNLQEHRRKRRRIVGKAGYDVTIEVPKEDSLLLAFSSEDETTTLKEIFLDAVETALTWLENTTAYARRGKHGGGKTAQTVQGNGFLGWYMIHPAARPVNGATIGDPHWHIHFTLANLVLADGQWSTVAAGGRDLMRHIAALQQLVHALIRHQLHTRLGVHYLHDTTGRHPRWKIAGIPDDAVHRFSKRNNDIHDALISLGYDPDTASRAQHRIAEQRTRNPRTDAHLDPDTTLQQLWQAEERDAGGDPNQHARRVYAGGHDPDDVDPPPQHPRVDAASIAQDLLDPESGLTAHSRRFSRIDALRRVAAALPTGLATPVELEMLTDQVLAHPGFVELPAKHTLVNGTGARRDLGSTGMRNATFYSTHDVVDAEKVILRAAKAGSPDQSDVRVTDTDLIALSIDIAQASLGYELADEQHTALMRLVTEGRAIDTVNGVPGSGKSTLMRAVRIVFENSGYVVGGAATAAVAALNLQAESGIRSRTVASIVHAIGEADSTVLHGVDVLVVDEANLTNDRDRAALYQRAAQTGTRIIEIGDSQQLRGVGVGSLFGRVHEIVGGAELRDNRRQAEEDERDAIAAWRDARYAEALTMWDGKGRLVATETSHEATAAMLAKWWEQRQGATDPHAEIRGLVMLAATNTTVTRLNQAAQALRLTENELGKAHTYALAGGGTKVLHVGDHILLRTNAWNDPQLADVAVLNGYRAVIRDIDHDGTITAEWQLEGPDGIETHTAHITSTYVAIGGADLGYALTVHKSEGLTVRDQWAGPDGESSGATVLFAAAGADNPALHVGTSRHRGAVWIYTGRQELEDDHDTNERGVPTTRAELTDRATEKLAERARATEQSPDDIPVVVQLGLPEFAAESGAEATQQQHQHDEDAAAAQREAERRKQQRAERTAAHRRARAEREAQDQRRQDTAALLLREVWRHEPDLVEDIINGAAFSAVARNITDIVDDSHLDIREVLAEIPLDTIASDDITDKTRFTAWAIRDAADRIVTGQADVDRDRATRRRAFDQMRDQTIDLLRETWADRPELAEAVIDSPAFDAVVRNLDRHTSAGFTARELLDKLPIRKIESPNVIDKAKFTAYSIARVAEREQQRREEQQHQADKAAAERHRLRITAEYLRDAWPNHPNLAQRVIDGPAFGALAQRVEQALDHDLSIPTILADIPPEQIGGSRVRNPSAFTTSLFTAAVERHQAEQQAQPTAPNRATAAAVAHWSQREHGRVDDIVLQAMLADAQHQLERLLDEQRQAHEVAADRRAEAENESGAHVREVEQNLTQWRERAAAIERILQLDTLWQAATQRAIDTAGERGELEHELEEQKGFSRARRTELTEKIDQYHRVETLAHAEARELAQQAASLQHLAGPRDQYDKVLARLRAMEGDYQHAREAAQRRDFHTAEAAERHAARLAEQTQVHQCVLESLHTEYQTRQQLPAHEHEAEQRQRSDTLEPVLANNQPELAPAPSQPHEHHIADTEYMPEPQAEPPTREL